uniref:NADH-plastoquinone oxidoreductase subunit 6 n=1 Tax=Torilis scabra TaxID=79188 RepID=A0A650DR44_9APIA|nr:NADH-plastoquinone oxidoreductase subunit 6 [Torilis scabra]
MYNPNFTMILTNKTNQSIVSSCSYSPSKSLIFLHQNGVLLIGSCSCIKSFLFQANLKYFESCNHSLLTLVNVPKQFDYNSIRDDHMSESSYSSVIDKQFVGQYSTQLPQNIQIPKSILELSNRFFLISVSNFQSTTGRSIGHTRTHTSQAMHLSNSKWIRPRKRSD